jgi:hypothetical protein
MQLQSTFVRIKRKSIIYFVLAILILGIVTPALAAYLGPNRVVTGATSVCKVVLYECQYVPSKDDWRYKKAGDWSCSSESKPWLDYPSDPSSQGCFAATAGDSYWSKEETLQEATITYPPATINSSLQNCNLNNGWCNTVPYLSLNGVEPVPGYNILALEGTLNGQSFACAGTTCSVPLSEGNNNFAYWALSSWGDTSEMGTLTTKVDSKLPTITGTLSGTIGLNNWYLSPASFNGSASDTTSGLASFTCTLDGVALPSCNSITVNAAGAHSLVLTARDNAGNTRLLNQNTSVDLHNPSLTASLIGLLGSNSWYNTATLSASAADPIPGSGLSAFQYDQDGSGWVSFPASGELALPEGKHTIDIRAIDNAGRTVSSSKSFWLDSIAPELLLTPSGTMGANNWYTSRLSLNASASDATSGVDIFEYSLDGGVWTPYSSALILTDGTHVLTFWAQDVSGLVTQLNLTYQVDTRAPQISGTLSGVLGKNNWYISNLTLSAVASDPTPGSGLDTFTYTLNGALAKPYTDFLILSDGVHTLQLDAQDKAGLTYSLGHSIKVDTQAPALNIQTTLPSWISNTVTVEGTASDPSKTLGQPSSGLSKVEVSTDGGHTWRTTTSNGSWQYDWDTAQNLNGVQELHIRATDNAGLITEQTIPVGVDNAAPKISLPDSWFQWDTVTLDIWDNDSGLTEARVEISDPEGRWPTRKINLDLNNFPMDFKWDRRFGDGTVAPLGTYDIKVIAFDSLGNVARKNADINILLGILPAGPASTPQPYIRAESNPLPITTAVPTLLAELPQNPIISTFGSTPEVAEQENTTTKSNQPAREAPIQVSVLDWLESVFVPNLDVAASKSIVESADTLNGASHSSASDSNVLWGATAVAMIGAATAYALDEKRKREEEAERNRAEIQSRIDEQYEQKIAAAEARKVAQWLEGQAILKAQELHELEMADVTDEERLVAYKQSDQYQAYQARMEDWRIEQAKWQALENADMTETEKLAQYKDSAEYKEREEALQQYHHDQRVQAADTARWEGLASQGQNAANMPEENWWEKTKSFVHNNVTEPFSMHFYDPYVKPAVEQTKDAFAAGIGWANATIYTPYILPKVEEIKQKLSDDFAWVNEHVYQPYVQPALEKTKQQISEDVAWVNAHIYQPFIQPMMEKTMQQLEAGVNWLNTNVYQPHLQPLLARINEVLYQPYAQPFLEKVKELVIDGTAWVNTNIYQPIFQPVVADLQDTWADYGEWVHSALDTAGFIPGLGEIADGLNGLIYLGEGRYIEASVSALAMIPILGDLGKAGKLTAAIGKELLEEGAEKLVKEAAEEFVEVVAKETGEQVAENLAKETGEELLATTTKETLEETAEKSLKEATEELAEKAAKQSADDVAQTSLKQAGKDLIEGASTEVAEKTTKAATERVVPNVASDIVATVPTTSIKEVSQTIAKEAVEETLEQTGEETAQLIVSLTEKYGKEAVEQFLPFCEKYGINPHDILARPPAEGQSLIGWGLGIDDLSNPVNHSLQKLDLTESKIAEILKDSAKNADSNIVVLGYGRGASIPYYKLGEELKACFLSLSEAAWAPFANARANFWTQINAPFIEKSIADRKIFLFNVDYDVITDPGNIERFSLPELRLIEQVKNDYVQVPVGEYTAFVPAEMMDTFDPADLLAKGV